MALAQINSDIRYDELLSPHYASKSNRDKLYICAMFILNHRMIIDKGILIWIWIILFVVLLSFYYFVSIKQLSRCKTIRNVSYICISAWFLRWPWRKMKSQLCMNKLLVYVKKQRILKRTLIFNIIDINGYWNITEIIVVKQNKKSWVK